MQAGSPADQSGFKAGDILVRLDAEPVTGVDDVFRLLDEHRIGKAVKATVIRSSGLVDIEVRPDEREREQLIRSAIGDCSNAASRSKVVCNLK